MARVNVLVTITAVVAAAAATALYASSGLARLHGPDASDVTFAVRLEVFGLLLVLAGLAWASRRHRPLGPMAPELPPRILRVVGTLMILAFVALMVDDLHSRPSAGGDATSRAVYVAICVVVIAIYAIAFLTVTSRAAPVDMAGLAVGTVIGLTAGLAWFGVMLSRPTLPGNSNWAVPTVLVTAALANLWTVVRTGRADQGMEAGLVASMTSALLIFLLTMLTFRVDGRRVPHIVDHAMIHGSTAAQKLAENRIEAPDFYIAVMLLGALLAVGLIWTILATWTRSARASREPVREQLVLRG
jgi:hypothetical protein